MNYIKAINMFLACAGTFTFLWHLTAIIRDAIVLVKFEDFIGVAKAAENLTEEDGKKVTSTLILGTITCLLWSLMMIY